jgi:hypothetical protein
MNVGMLWFDGDNKCDVESRVKRAADFYKSKYGRAPNLCFVHPQTLEQGQPASVDGIKILSSMSVLPDHFWLGVEEEKSRVLRQQVAA